MVSPSISQAMKCISSEKCSKCGSQAKGLVYRKQAVTYYCKRCLRKHTKQDDMLVKGNGAKIIS
jgi:late competence protein required for DNA uptake (superfamily II DNA/RNA helicase)